MKLAAVDMSRMSGRYPAIQASPLLAPDRLRIARSWDLQRVALVAIDPQIDFMSPNGAS
jgi:hypothetical protein